MLRLWATELVGRRWFRYKPLPAWQDCDLPKLAIDSGRQMKVWRCAHQPSFFLWSS